MFVVFNTKLQLDCRLNYMLFEELAKLLINNFRKLSSFFLTNICWIVSSVQQRIEKKPLYMSTVSQQL